MHSTRENPDWEKRYASGDRVWSGKPNPVLADVAGNLDPGCALDIGSGEGGDVIWLAERGWKAVGLELSATANRRAEKASERLSDRSGTARFITSDLTDLEQVLGEDAFDLVAVSYLHSPERLARTEILERVAPFVRVGGTLLITSHAPQSETGGKHFSGPSFYPRAEDDVATIAAVPGMRWKVLEEGIRKRPSETSEEGDLRPDIVVRLLRQS